MDLPEASSREALTFEAVQLAVESGVDVNVKGTDGRTALDGAKTLKYDGRHQVSNGERREGGNHRRKRSGRAIEPAGTA